MMEKNCDRKINRIGRSKNSSESVRILPFGAGMIFFFKSWHSLYIKCEYYRNQIR